MKMGKYIDWIRFDRLLEMWELNGFELRQIIKKGHLPAYYLRYTISEHPDFIEGINPIPTPIQDWDVEVDLISERLVFKPEDIERLWVAGQENLPSLQETKKARPDGTHLKRNTKQRLQECFKILVTIQKLDFETYGEVLDHPNMKKIFREQNFNSRQKAKEYLRPVAKEIHPHLSKGGRPKGP